MLHHDMRACAHLLLKREDAGQGMTVGLLLQTVQYIQPQQHAALAQAELLVIDEAAAIPLPVVRAMLGPYLVFLASTVNGWVAPGLSSLLSSPLLWASGCLAVPELAIMQGGPGAVEGAQAACGAAQ